MADPPSRPEPPTRPDTGERPRLGCGARLALLLIVVLVNLPLLNLGWSRLWQDAPALLALALAADLCLLVVLVLGTLAALRRRAASAPRPGPPR